MTVISLLGATGSIGQQTLAVIAASSTPFELYALTANDNVAALYHLCQQYQPQVAVMVNADAAEQLQQQIKANGLPVTVLSGEQALVQVSQDAAVDVVVNGIVGFAGLAPTLAAIEANKRILLANKEVFVTAGELFTRALAQSQAKLFPLDSEHHALFECFHGEMPLSADRLAQLHQVTLTASGGPLREMPLANLASVTAEQAAAHPNWQMGQKISIDSATLVNKAFEVIEAHYLFNIPYAKIQVLCHPQSLVHACAQFCDGSMQMQLAHPDMRLSISRGLHWPERMNLDLPVIKPVDLNQMQFTVVDNQRYPCFAYILDTLQQQPESGVVINAANEMAVQAFLHRQIGYSDIFTVIKHTTAQTLAGTVNNLQQLKTLDRLARQTALHLIQTELNPNKEIA